MKKIIIIMLCVVFLSGCATFDEAWKRFLGKSTVEIEKYRKDAAVKVLACGYDECYKNVDEALAGMDNVSIYAKKKDLIAVYYAELNTTPVGIFFTAVDPGRTRVEISSPANGPKDRIAKALFKAGGMQ